MFIINVIIIRRYITEYINTGIKAEIGLSKNDLFLNNSSGKKATNKFNIIFSIVLIFLFFILNIWVKHFSEKNKDKDEVNINIKNHINTVIFSIEFMKLTTCIFLSTM